MKTNTRKLPHSIPVSLVLVVGAIEIIAATTTALWTVVLPEQALIAEKLLLSALVGAKGITMLLLGATRSWKNAQREMWKEGQR